jgi:hypothetical protein
LSLLRSKTRNIRPEGTANHEAILLRYLKDLFLKEANVGKLATLRTQPFLYLSYCARPTNILEMLPGEIVIFMIAGNIEHPLPVLGTVLEESLKPLLLVPGTDVSAQCQIRCGRLEKL